MAHESPMDWRIVYGHIFPRTRPGIMCDGWEVREISLLTGEITRLARDREGFFRLSEGNSAVRHVYDKGSFYGIVDIVNPWDYSLTMDGIDAFICDNVFVPDNEPFDEIHGHEMESAYRAQRASHK